MTDADAHEPTLLELSDFEPHRGTVFELTGEGVPGAPLPLTLADTRSLVAGDGLASRRQPFGLVFRGPAQPLLPQRIYRLAHPRLGSHDLFLVPIGRKPEGVEYEAIFT